MIFATGLFMFVAALAVTAGMRPREVPLWICCLGLIGVGLMLVSGCILIARVMP